MTYAEKRRINGADFYGRWDQGKQTMTETINNNVLKYDHRKREWNGVLVKAI